MAAKKKATENSAEVLTAAVETQTVAEEAIVEVQTEEAAVENAEGQTVKAIVKRVFKDKNTGRIYNVGDVLEVTAERLAEINSQKIRAQQI